MPFSKGVVHKHKSPGRPKGFRGVARLIMEKTNDAKELVDFALAVFRDPEQTFDARWAALEWLANRGIGRPVEMIELAAALEVEHVGTPPPLNLAALNRQQRGELRDLLTRALGRPRDVARTPTGETLRIIHGGGEDDAPIDVDD